MENQVSKGQAILYWAITVVFFYLLGSLFSWDFDMSEWHRFSRIVFWGPSILITTWTIVDDFLFPNR